MTGLLNKFKLFFTFLYFWKFLLTKSSFLSKGKGNGEKGWLMITLNNLWNSYNLLFYVYDGPWIFSRICGNPRSLPLYILRTVQTSTKNIATLFAFLKKVNLLSIKEEILANRQIVAKKAMVLYDNNNMKVKFSQRREQ